MVKRRTKKALEAFIVSQPFRRQSSKKPSNDRLFETVYSCLEDDWLRFGSTSVELSRLARTLSVEPHRIIQMLEKLKTAGLVSVSGQLRGQKFYSLRSEKWPARDSQEPAAEPSLESCDEEPGSLKFFQSKQLSDDDKLAVFHRAVSRFEFETVTAALDAGFLKKATLVASMERLVLRGRPLSSEAGLRHDNLLEALEAGRRLFVLRGTTELFRQFWEHPHVRKALAMNLIRTRDDLWKLYQSDQSQRSQTPSTTRQRL